MFHQSGDPLGPTLSFSQHRCAHTHWNRTSASQQFCISLGQTVVHSKTLKVSTLIPTPGGISTLRSPPPQKGPLRRVSTSTPHLPEGGPGGCLVFGTWVFVGQSLDLLWRSHLGACPNEYIECSAADLLSNISTPIRPSVHPTIGCATPLLGDPPPPMDGARRGATAPRRRVAVVAVALRHHRAATPALRHDGRWRRRLLQRLCPRCGINNVSSITSVLRPTVAKQ